MSQTQTAQTPSNTSQGDFIRILLAILLPPIGVFLQVGFGIHFWLNILLTILGYIPGIIHAVWIITRK
ncbi:MAG: YqaE/Pmp3 family membrane protein [Verrucomicrobiae bacterium]|nr:YqaE/Pmp3 family membrane protein [Verrucomicrobiae bacterium]